MTFGADGVWLRCDAAGFVMKMYFVAIMSMSILIVIVMTISIVTTIVISIVVCGDCVGDCDFGVVRVDTFSVGIGC